MNAPTTRAQARLALALLVAAGIAIGFSGILVRLSDMAPMASAFWRMAFSFPLLLLWAARTARPRDAARPPTRRDRALLAFAGVLYAAELAIWHWSLQWTSVANATVIANFYPVFVTLYVWLLFGERVSRGFLMGLATAVAGMAILAGENLEMGGDGWFGDLLSIATSVFYAGYLVLVARLRTRFSTATIVAWSSGAASVVLAPIALAAGHDLIAPTTGAWLALLGLGLVCQAGAHSAIAYALAHLPAPLSAVTLMIQPLTAGAMAWLILGEALSPSKAVGGAVLIAGIFLARRGGGR